MKQMEADVVVIAAGPAGLGAAVAAAERGASVIVFEKANTTGGTGNMGMGPFAVESKLQRTKNISLSREQAFRIFMDYTHWRVDAKLVSDYINKTADTIDWLEKMGVEFVDAIAYIQGSHFTHHLVRPSTGGRPGPHASGTMMKIMTDRARELGVKFHLQTPAKKLIKEGGKITGVIAEDESGEEISVKTKAAIVATGGFGDNPEMIKKYTEYEWGRDLFSMRTPGVTGDGIRMAWEVGAAAEGLNIELTCGVRSSRSAFEFPTVAGALRQPNLMVNLFGERFMNEEIVGNPTFTGNAVSRQKNRCAFIIFDSDTAQHYQDVGFDWINYMNPALKVDNFEEEFTKTFSEDEFIFAADSLEELAQRAGINVENLLKTVEEYNRACETGRDNVFHKNPRYLRPVRKPKFYTGKYAPSGYGTLGGIKINYRTEVVDKNQEPIPGLYAAGTDANSIYADSYIFIFPGNSMSFAINSGRIAGENAVEYVRKSG